MGMPLHGLGVRWSKYYTIIFPQKLWNRHHKLCVRITAPKLKNTVEKGGRKIKL